MAIVTVAELLQHAEVFERMLVEFYERIAEHTQREGVRLLTNYTSRYRQRIAGSAIVYPLLC